MSDFDQLAQLLKAHREAAAIACLPLGVHSKVLVAGAYKGETMKFVLDLFEAEQVTVYGFEPQTWACGEASKLLASYPSDRWKLFNYGLATHTGQMYMHDFGTDRCAVSEDGALCDFREAISELVKISADAMILNMEGYEYQLLPHIVDADMRFLPEFVLVQVHGNVKDNDVLDDMFQACGYGVTWEYGNWILWERAQ